MRKYIEKLKTEVKLELQEALDDRENSWDDMTKFLQGECMGRIESNKHLINLIDQLGKSDLLVIPEEVHLWLAEVKKHFTLVEVIEVFFSEKAKEEGALNEAELWAKANIGAVAEAWRTGDYEVETECEPKYRVKLLPCESGYLNRIVNELFLSDTREIYGYQTEFTEHEIKDINPLYWHFREKVEG